VRGFAGYGVARMLVEALLALRGVVLAAILGPELFGVWAIFRVIMRYCGSAGLGMLRGLELEASAPRAAEGIGPETARAESAGTALGFLLLVFGPLSLLAAGVAGLRPDEWLAPALAGVAGGLVFDRLWSYGTTYLRATSDLWRLALFELINAALQIALVLALAYLWGLKGALLGFVLANAAALLFLLGRVPMRPSLSLPRLRSLLNTGFPVGLTFLLATGLTTIDRVAVAAFGGAGLLGYYAFAVALSSLGAAVALVLRTQVFPEVYRDARARGAPSATDSHLRGNLAPFTWVFSPILGVFALALDPAVRYFVPEYESAIPAARIFLFTGVVAGLANLATLGVIAADRQWLLPLLTAGALVLNLALAVAALVAGLGLEGLAAATLLGRTVYASSIVVAAARGSGLTDWPALLARTLLPLVWCAGVVGVLGRLVPVAGGLGAVAVFVAYPLALLPLVPFGRVALREFRQSAPSGAGRV
jgi:O-antigen/teichoic acid export membrane protein